MATKAKQIIAMSAPVEITAGEAQGDKTGPAKFTASFYTGGRLDLDNYDLPVVVDLAGLKNGKVLVANLDHERKQRVGNFAVANDGKTLVASGTASAATPARDEVVNSARDGYQWQSSLEVSPERIEQVKAGRSVEVNGQKFDGPLYVTRAGTLKGFAFVSHGADDNTNASIAAEAASTKGKTMKAECQTWVEDTLGMDVSTLTAEQLANFEADFDGRAGKRTIKGEAAKNPFEARRAEAKRRKDIRDIADRLIEARDSDEDEIVAIEKMCGHAIEAKMSVQDFRLELYESTELPRGATVRPPKAHLGVNNKVIEAAICMAGRLEGYEELFDDQTLQTAHDKFKNGIGLKQLWLLGAEAAGFHGSYASDVTLDVQRAAFGMIGHQQIKAAGFSTLVLPTIISNTANLFLRQGWNAIDLTPLRVAAIRSVRNFQTITTASLTGALQYEKVGATGEIKHGTLGDLSYTNKADTYAKMLTISRQDIINDDLNCLTDVPRKLGRGAALKLNDIFWTEFLALVGASFFASGNANINTGVADMTVGGLDATEVIFMNQTDPDGKPLGISPKIVLVPTALRNKADILMTSQFTGAQVTTLATGPGVDNPFRGRFRVESSPYISNSSYTGYTSTAWWMLADPNELPVIEIVALNGRVEPVVETADAEFNVLGVSMRGYSDVGVKRQEYRGGVHADGGSS